MVHPPFRYKIKGVFGGVLFLIYDMGLTEKMQGGII